MRLFLALPLPDALLRSLDEASRELRRTLPGWRWTRSEGIHLTLRFLGEVPAGDVAEQSASWRSAAEAHGPIGLEAGGIGAFPSARRPRVLWVGVRETGTPGALAGLAASLERAARDLGFAPEDRPFRAHLTLARAASPLARAPGPDSFGILGTFEAVELRLYRSELAPGGARYTVIDSYPFRGGPGR